MKREVYSLISTTRIFLKDPSYPSSSREKWWHEVKNLSQKEIDSILKYMEVSLNFNLKRNPEDYSLYEFFRSLTEYDPRKSHLERKFDEVLGDSNNSRKGDDRKNRK